MDLLLGIAALVLLDQLGRDRAVPALARRREQAKVARQSQLDPRLQPLVPKRPSRLAGRDARFAYEQVLAGYVELTRTSEPDRTAAIDALYALFGKPPPPAHGTG